MRALIQQISSGHYWKTGTGWVKERDEAEGFASSNAAILFCVATEMRDTRIVLTFGDPNLDVLLHPFGEQGHRPTGEELIEQSRATRQSSRSLVQMAKNIVAGMRQTVAAMKESKKQRKFERKQVSDDEP